jgi:hypothetical protein
VPKHSIGDVARSSEQAPMQQRSVMQQQAMQQQQSVAPMLPVPASLLQLAMQQQQQQYSMQMQQQQQAMHYTAMQQQALQQQQQQLAMQQQHFMLGHRLPVVPALRAVQAPIQQQSGTLQQQQAPLNLSGHQYSSGATLTFACTELAYSAGCRTGAASCTHSQ